VLAENLLANRCCPEELRPDPVCLQCRRLEERCACPGGFQPHFPEHFLERVLRKTYHIPNQETLWGVCLSCGAAPCACAESAAEVS
jgi:hypothetical protein